MSFVNVYRFVCASFPFGFDGGMWDLIVLVHDHCLLCPRHEMAEGHIESYLSVYVCVCVFQNSVRLITSSCIMGFENNLAQMIIMTRRYVAYKSHVDMFKVKVTLHT